MLKTYLVMILLASQALPQTQPKESEPIQALLAEVRRLRQDIEAMTVASQRTQIALYALQMQDAAVARSSQRLEAVRTRCTGEDGHRQQIATEIQRVETALTSGSVPQNEIKINEGRLAAMKQELEATQITVQTCQAGEAETASQLRNDQATLAEIRDRIDRLDKLLAKSSDSSK